MSASPLLLDEWLELPDEIAQAVIVNDPVVMPAWGAPLVHTIRRKLEEGVGPCELVESRLVFLTATETVGIYPHRDFDAPELVSVLVYFTEWRREDGGRLSVAGGGTLDPHRGRLLAFPSNVMHHVEPWTGEGYRGSWRLIFRRVLAVHEPHAEPS